MSDEIGHFEYCSKINPNNLSCKKSGGFDSNNPDPEDDQGCFPTSAFPSSRVQVGGCIAEDLDFDGTSYDAKAWPGSISNPVADRLLTTAPVTFTSPTNGGRGQLRHGLVRERPAADRGLPSRLAVRRRAVQLPAAHCKSG